MRTQDRAIEQLVDVPIILLYFLFVINDVQKILEISKNLAPQHWIIFPCYLIRQVLPHFSLAETSPVATSSPEAVPRAILSASFNTTMETWTKVCKYQHQHLLVLVMLLHLDYPLGNWLYFMRSETLLLQWVKIYNGNLLNTNYNDGRKWNQTWNYRSFRVDKKVLIQNVPKQQK